MNNKKSLKLYTYINNQRNSVHARVLKSYAHMLFEYFQHKLNMLQFYFKAKQVKIDQSVTIWFNEESK